MDIRQLPYLVALPRGKHLVPLCLLTPGNQNRRVITRALFPVGPGR